MQISHLVFLSVTLSVLCYLSGNLYHAMYAYYNAHVIVDHRTGQNFIIPEMADSSLDLSELAKAAKKKLQAVSF